MKVEILSPSGCCQGVNNAINIAKQARLDHPHDNIYILGALVHNEEVVNRLEKMGIMTLTTPIEAALESIDKGVVIFTAHGHDEKFEQIAKDKGLIIYDTTCPFVKYNHNSIKDHLDKNDTIIFVGKNGHPETMASLSISNRILFYDLEKGIDYNYINVNNPCVIFQTTLSIFEVEEIKHDILSHFPKAQFLKSVCHATFERQNALKNINSSCDLILIVGSTTSSNTTKLYEIATNLYPNKQVKRIKTVKDLLDCNYQQFSYVTIVGGASTPLDILLEISNYLSTL